MITITRSTARLVRAMFRKALGITARGRLFTVLIEASSAGLVFKCRNFNLAAEYQVPGQYPADTLAIPFELLQDCEGSKDDPVQLKLYGKGTIEALWPDGSIPQIKQYVAGKPDDVLRDYPPFPGTFAENPPHLLSALRDATDTSDPNAIRYATNMIQLRGATGAIGATDGRHLLLQRGFTFPWEEEVLIPVSKAFGCKELASEEPVQIGRTDKWVTLRTGNWSLHFQIDKDGRFPHIDDHIQPVQSAQVRLQVSEADAQFLAQALDRLPCDEERHFAVTVDLNGQVVVRAKTAEQPRVTELRLCGSQSTGKPMVLSTNRRYLARAIALGFREILVFSNDRPVLCQDARRSYVWALLEPDGAIKPSENPIRIESPAQDAATSHEPHVPRREMMPRRKTNDFGVVPATGASESTSNGHTNGTSNGAAHAEHNGEVSLIEQAEAVRTSLKESADKVGELVAALKRHRKQSRLVQSTLSSLRQLQKLDA